MNANNEPQGKGYGPLASLGIIVLTILIVTGIIYLLVSLTGALV